MFYYNYNYNEYEVLASSFS